MHAFVLLAYFAFLAPAAHSAFTTISSAADFVAFADEVNSGTTYRGSTVTLLNDLDFTGISFLGVGRYVNTSTPQRPFRGTFEGNGHTVSNMHLYSTEATYLGLFSLVNGGMIKGVVVDSSCTVENNVTAYYTYAGGIVANSIAGIEFKLLDCVNMATVTGTGPNSNIGGIIGCLYALSSTATVYNCVNFGNVTQLGTVSGAVAGGIVGWITRKENSTLIPAIYNCVNLGTVTSGSTNVGAIMGYKSSKTVCVIKNAFWLSGFCVRPFPSTAAAETSEALGADFSVNGGELLVDVLNAYVDTVPELGLRKWGKVTFNANGGSPVSPRSSLLVMLGEPGATTKEGHSFEGWYADAEFGDKWTASMVFSGDATLYAKWDVSNYTLTFDFGNGTVEERVLDFNESIEYPENMTRDGYIFNGWNSTITRMPAEDFTIKALWTKAPTEYVEIVFERKDVSEKDIRDIITRFTQGDDFEIKIFEAENGETKVIVKFVDAKKADEFLESIGTSSNVETNLIKRIGYVDGLDYDGFSNLMYVLPLYLCFLLALLL